MTQGKPSGVAASQETAADLGRAIEGMKRLGLAELRGWAAEIETLGSRRAAKGTNWISVDDSLPDSGHLVLLWFKRGVGSYDIGLLGSDGWRWPNGCVYQIPPTHWMPLPPAPPEVK